MNGRSGSKLDADLPTAAGQSYVRHLLPRLARQAGIERRVHAHGLRHAFAVDLVRSGAPLYVVRDALGHSSVGDDPGLPEPGRRPRGR